MSEHLQVRALRQRLLARVARSAVAARQHHTVRHADAPVGRPAAGVTLRQLHAADAGRLRPGEPAGAWLIEVAPGAQWKLPGTVSQRSWLVLAGDVILDELALGPLDHHLAGGAAVHLATPEDGSVVRLLLREAPAEHTASAVTQRAAHAEWTAYAPGVWRRVLSQRDGLAAVLYHALPGTRVPRHGHRHDEECLMLDGDLFLDDVLLRPLDYQLAPAGSEHGSVFTDTGALLYAHGDLELDVLD